MSHQLYNHARQWFPGFPALQECHCLCGWETGLTNGDFQELKDNRGKSWCAWYIGPIGISGQKFREISRQWPGVAPILALWEMKNKVWESFASGVEEKYWAVFSGACWCLFSREFGWNGLLHWWDAEGGQTVDRAGLVCTVFRNQGWKYESVTGGKRKKGV